MKHLFMGLLALTIGAGAARAQETTPPQHTDGLHHPGHGRHEGHPRGHMLAAKLHFTDQQKQQVKDIREKHRQQLADLKKNEDITVREYKSKLAAIRKDEHEQMQAVLTPEQKAQVEKMKAEQHQLAEVNAKARAEKLKIKLGLSDDQAKKLQDLHHSTAARMKQIREDQSLSTDQKKEQLKSLRQDQRQQLQSVLSPEQLKQLQDMRHARQREWSR